jgi:hypothetical protein
MSEELTEQALLSDEKTQQAKKCPDCGCGTDHSGKLYHLYSCPQVKKCIDCGCRMDLVGVYHVFNCRHYVVECVPSEQLDECM